MKILFTGAGSFTGMWLASALTEVGHEVVMTFTREHGAYDGVHGERVERSMRLGRSVLGCRFGDEKFMKLVVGTPRWDVLCHHAAEATDYKNPDFDVAGALRNNTHNAHAVMEALAERGCRRVLLTGTVFENGEGAGSDLPAFSPYGLSKSFTSQMFEHYARLTDQHMGKFVIPNPFGPFEEPRFTSYLVRSWMNDKTPSVRTPTYIRDNIHITLLARAYRQFVESLPDTPGSSRMNPSGYIESQGDFALRVAREMRPRLDLPCEVKLDRQVQFAEPRIRVNTDFLDHDSLGWHESDAWDGFADYYQETVALSGERGAEVVDAAAQSAPAASGGTSSGTFDLLVVIINYRVADLTIDCLKSLKAELPSLPRPRVVVLENGSGDDSAERIAACIEREGLGEWVELMTTSPNLGFAGGNNHVLRAELAARDFKYVVLLNADTVVHEGCLRYCFDVMEGDDRIGAMSCRLLNVDGTPQATARRFPTPLRAVVASFGLPWKLPRLFGWADLEDPGWDRNTVKRDVEWIGGAFLWVRGDLMQRIGVLDDDFGFYGEDIEYSHRVWKSGYRVHYDPGGTITHLGGGSNDPDAWPDRVRHAHFLRARYVNQLKCYGRLPATVLRIVDTCMWGLRTAWLGLTGRRDTVKYRNAAQTFGLLRKRLEAPKV